MLVSFRRVKTVTDSEVKFGVIPHDHWNQPDWIDEEKATKAREQMVKDSVIYGGTCSLRRSSVSVSNGTYRKCPVSRRVPRCESRVSTARDA